ncbi:MAG: hypothetical protein AAGG00_17150 [Cyanobacteria bacterium P01_H01_bin.150]
MPAPQLFYIFALYDLAAHQCDLNHFCAKKLNHTLTRVNVMQGYLSNEKDKNFINLLPRVVKLNHSNA